MLLGFRLQFCNQLLEMITSNYELRVAESMQNLYQISFIVWKQFKVRKIEIQTMYVVQKGVHNKSYWQHKNFK